MSKKILIISGSPKKDGNTALLIKWFIEGAREKNAVVEIVNAAYLKYKHPGCISCRQCQKNVEYGCVIDDDAGPVLIKMISADVIVMASPLYFFGASSQIKILVDRMFSLYKWDNAAGTMQTPLKGKTLVFLGSAFEDIGLDALEKPFALTAEYTGMPFESLLVAHAGTSGEIVKLPEAQDRAKTLGRKVA
ncbi:MAG: flavodoxin family protein [Candidatus Omnitrophica bacterium]|nr:flavodoxin family protein [Candidatus Omnitrophota bacterium]